MVIQADPVMFIWTLQKFDSQDIAVQHFWSLKPECEAWHLCPCPRSPNKMFLGLDLFIITYFTYSNYPVTFFSVSFCFILWVF